MSEDLRALLMLVIGLCVGRVAGLGAIWIHDWTKYRRR